MKQQIWCLFLTYCSRQTVTDCNPLKSEALLYFPTVTNTYKKPRAFWLGANRKINLAKNKEKKLRHEVKVVPKFKRNMSVYQLRLCRETLVITNQSMCNWISELDVLW